MKFSVKQARLYAGLTQEEISHKLNVSRATYVGFEKHPEKMPIAKAKEFSRITRISLDEIFFASIST